MRTLKWAPLLLVLAAGVAALSVGASAPGQRSLEQRAAGLAAQVRCPVCEGQSVAQSDAPAALAIRQRIRQELQAGVSPQAILDGLAREYGQGILERPEAHGVTLLVWVLPAAGAVCAAAGLVLAFRRWRPRRGAVASEEDRALVEEALGGRSP